MNAARPRIAFVVLMLAVSSIACPAAQNASLEPWAKRLRGVTREGWTVTVKDDSIVIARVKPIRWLHPEINGPAGSTGDEPPPESRLEAGVYRLRLRFGQRMSMQDYERLAGENAAMMKERDRLDRSVNDIAHKFDEYVPGNAAERKRLDDYHSAVAKLKWHDLPDLYCEDQSIWLYTSDNGWTSVHGKDDREECEGVRQSVLRFFAMYDPARARDGTAGKPDEP